MMKTLRSYIHIILFAYWTVLFIATTLPGSYVPPTGIGDKYEHFLAFAILAILVYFSLMQKTKWKLLTRYTAVSCFIVGTVYGAMDELHQLFVPGRYCDFYDWLADSIGTVIGILAATGLSYLYRHYISNRETSA
ncbi:MAG: VanZ family protein [Ignavibacteria bacterium]|nr:VanZ family protein [Ignavibacteria bacterium]